MKKIIKIFLVLLCMTIIFVLSNDTAYESSNKSNSIIVDISEMILNRKLTTKEKELYTSKFDFWIRKAAHLIIYIILGILVISLLKEYMIINKKSIIFSIIIVMLYSISDEIHQAFVPGRSCELRDIIIDSSGGIIGTYLYYFINRIKVKKV